MTHLVRIVVPHIEINNLPTDSGRARATRLTRGFESARFTEILGNHSRTPVVAALFAGLGECHDPWDIDARPRA
jgi:hypothetical protein